DTNASEAPGPFDQIISHKAGGFVQTKLSPPRVHFRSGHVKGENSYRQQHGPATYLCQAGFAKSKNAHPRNTSIPKAGIGKECLSASMFSLVREPVSWQF